jgi:hypothetical protein
MTWSNTSNVFVQKGEGKKKGKLWNQNPDKLIDCILTPTKIKHYKLTLSFLANRLIPDPIDRFYLAHLMFIDS